MFKKVIGLMVGVMFVMVAAGCSSAVKTGPLSKIVIMPEKGQVVVGKTLELTAKGYDSKGNLVTVNPTWRVITAKIGTLNNTVGEKVIFTGKTVGTSAISVDFKQMSARTTIEVVKSKR